MGNLERLIETEAVCIYSPKYDGEELNEFEKFLENNHDQPQQQLQDFFGAILSAIEKIMEVGARENLFRGEGGGVKALPGYLYSPRVNRRIGKMRLYCLRLSTQLLVFGNGGVTTKQKLGEDPLMLAFVGDLRDIERHIRLLARRTNTDYDDLVSMKQILEAITL